MQKDLYVCSRYWHRSALAVDWTVSILDKSMLRSYLDCLIAEEEIEGAQELGAMGMYASCESGRTLE